MVLETGSEGGKFKMNFISRYWQKYIDWCDSMGLAPDNRRSCLPRLSEPELINVSKRQPEASQQEVLKAESTESVKQRSKSYE